MNSNRWKYFLILILAVILFHILIIKIFVIGSNSDGNAPVIKDVPPVSEPPMPPMRKK